MGESAKHMELVEMVRREALAIVPPQYAPLIQVDSPDSEEKARVGNYSPDVYYSYDNQLVIGEAKTLEDFSRKHSQDQFEAYLAASNAFPGKSVLIVAVPWMLFATAKNYFRRRVPAGGRVQVIVLDDTKGRREI